MKYRKNNKAFTFIELIITVTILVILGVIGFFTFINYLEGARDSSEITSLNNIKTTLVNFKLNKGLYPQPTNSIDITYSGAVVWSQGTFGKDVIKKIIGSKSVFLDPYSNNEYTYSISNNKKEFQIAGVLENISYNNIFSSSYAESKRKGKAIVLGDYNGRIINISIYGINNILALPSIISSDLNSTNLIDIINSNKLVYNGSYNLPFSYNSSSFDINGGQNLSSNNLVIFSGSLSNFKLESNRIILLDKLKKSYKGTLVSNIGKKYFTNLNIDLKNPSVKVLSLACDIVEFNLNYPVNCNNDSFFAVPIFNNLNLLNIDFSGLISQNVNVVFQDNNNNLWFGTNKGLSKYSSGSWTSYTSSNGLINNKVKIITQASNGNLWFGTKGGISVLNPILSTWTSYTSSNGLVNNEVKTIVGSSNGNMWIGTDKGISIFNPTASNWTPYVNVLVNKEVKTIIKSSNGNMWIGTDKGISVFNPNLSVWTSYVDVLVNKEVKTIIKSSNGNMWIGTNKGISVFNPISGIWTSYIDILISTNINNIFQSTNQYIWVATYKGVSMFDGINWKQYTVTDGLISNKVKSIFQDNNGNMWFITKKGLSKLVSGIFTNYPNGNKQGIYVVYKSNGVVIIGIN